ncbi:MAG: DUF2889 domain-containing protein [Acidimicrobiales bacterium]|nr:DUF2889 domain-containing protein [Acidimicrobiales bacterium]
MQQRPAPPHERAVTITDRRTQAPRLTAGAYGSGLYRRRIRLVRLADHHTAGELEDDFHHFRIDLHHDGATIGRARGTALRGPWTTCFDASSVIRSIEGHPIDARSSSIGDHTPARHNCTHLFDLTGLAVAHAARSDEDERIYDFEVTDRAGNPVTNRATVWRNGELALDWQLENGEIVGPAAWAGAPLRRGFIQWAEEGFEPDLAEAAIALRRVVDISMGRSGDLDRYDVADEVMKVMGPVCHTFQPDVGIHARRNKGSALVFSDLPAVLLSDMHLRDSAAQHG